MTEIIKLHNGMEGSRISPYRDGYMVNGNRFRAKQCSDTYGITLEFLGIELHGLSAEGVMKMIKKEETKGEMLGQWDRVVGPLRERFIKASGMDPLQWKETMDKQIRENEIAYIKRMREERV